MKVIEKFADKVISSGAYKPLDRVYVINKIRGLVGDHDEEENDQAAVKQLVDMAVKNKKIPDDVTSREVLNDQLYDLATPTPSETNSIFWQKMEKSSEKATDWFYKLCVNNNYVKKEAIARNVVFQELVQKDMALKLRLICPSQKKIQRLLQQRLIQLAKNTHNVLFALKTKATQVAMVKMLVLI